jgi:peroxiredoxin
MPLLNTSDPFLQLTVNTTGGQALTIPDAFAGHFAVVLFNRGAWRPFCPAQLRAFERASATLAETASASSGSRSTTRRPRRRWAPKIS